MHEDWGSTPAAIDAALRAADEHGLQVALHSDSLNEAGFVESTLAAMNGTSVMNVYDRFRNSVAKKIDAMIAKSSSAGAPEQMIEIANKLRTTLVTRCQADSWAQPVLDCFASASDQPSIRNCRTQLPPDQAQAELEMGKADVSKVLASARKKLARLPELRPVAERLLPRRGAKPNYPAAKIVVEGRTRTGRA